MTGGDRGSRVRDPRSLISRRINAERIVLLGWGRAILLQLAHPLIAAGVHDHSGFRATTWAAMTRLYHTVHAMLALTFGTDEERERALGGIRQIHQRVNGQLRSAAGRFPAGTVYSAENPDLVLWVHATLLESVPLAYEQLVGPLTIAERDAYCAEAAPLAVALLARRRLSGVAVAERSPDELRIRCYEPGARIGSTPPARNLSFIAGIARSRLS